MVCCTQQQAERVAAGRVIGLAGEVMVLCCASGAGDVCLASKVAPIVFKHAHPELPHRAAVFCGAPHVDLVLLDSNAEYQTELAGAALLVQGLFWLLAGYLPCFLCLKALDYP